MLSPLSENEASQTQISTTTMAKDNFFSLGVLIITFFTSQLVYDIFFKWNAIILMAKNTVEPRLMDIPQQQWVH